MLFIRVLFSTCLVLGLIWYVARVVRQPKGLFSKIRQPFGGNMVESRTALNRTAMVAVVRFADQRLLVAVNENAISVLATAPLEQCDTAEVPLGATATDGVDEVEAVKQLLDRPSFIESLRGLTVRTVAGDR